MSEPLNPTPSHLLICQVGPVQDFIALARSTRDCWSGSFLLSWMMAQWIAKCRQELPHIEFVFPVLTKKSPEKTDVPTLDWIEGHRPTDVASIKNALLPAITNRVMASFPAGHPMDTTQLSQKISQITHAVFNYDNEQSVWRKICDQCYKYITPAGTTINDLQTPMEVPTEPSLAGGVAALALRGRRESLVLV
jgi:hypothetical protein